MSDIKNLTPEEKEALAGPRNPDGTVRKGNQLGKLAAGTPKYHRKLEREKKRLEAEMNQKAADQAQSMLHDKLGDVLDVLYTNAMGGCPKSLSLWLRHSTPVAQKSNKVDTDVLAEVANLPAEERLRYINRAMLEGEIDVTMGKDLLQAQKAEMEATTLNRIQKLARRVTREELSLEQLAHEFGQIAEDLEPVLIEGRTDGEG